MNPYIRSIPYDAWGFAKPPPSLGIKPLVLTKVSYAQDENPPRLLPAVRDP